MKDVGIKMQIQEIIDGSKTHRAYNRKQDIVSLDPHYIHFEKIWIKEYGEQRDIYSNRWFYEYGIYGEVDGFVERVGFMSLSF